MFKRCHPGWFDIKLKWASQQPSFQCVRDGDDLEYWVNGRPMLRVVKVGVRAELYSYLGERMEGDVAYK